jgi:hypothetical protein
VVRDQRDQNRKLDKGAVHEGEADVVRTNVAQYEVGNRIASIGGGEADRREDCNQAGGEEGGTLGEDVPPREPAPFEGPDLPSPLL